MLALAVTHNTLDVTKATERCDERLLQWLAFDGAVLVCVLTRCLD